MHRPRRDAAELFYDMSRFGHWRRATVLVTSPGRLRQTVGRDASDSRLLKISIRQSVGIQWLSNLTNGIGGSRGVQLSSPAEGRLRGLIWLRYVERRWTEGHISGLGPRWIYRKARPVERN
jgi:hypothetical protein